MSEPINRTISVAPMLDWTDKHCRYFLRQISQHALLYTEMVTTGAIIFGKGDYLGYNQEEHPVALHSAKQLKYKWRCLDGDSI